MKNQKCACGDVCCHDRGAANPDRRWATALTGFIAGAICATIVLLPWLIIESKLVESEKVPPAPMTQDELELDAMLRGEDTSMGDEAVADDAKMHDDTQDASPVTAEDPPTE